MGSEPEVRTIHKYVLPFFDRVPLRMPADANVLSVGEQGGRVCLWAEVDTDTYAETRAFCLRGTGNPLDGTEGRFIGTVQIGLFVWHVYEERG